MGSKHHLHGSNIQWHVSQPSRLHGLVLVSKQRFTLAPICIYSKKVIGRVVVLSIQPDTFGLPNYKKGRGLDHTGKNVQMCILLCKLWKWNLLCRI